jgi:cell wall-associated NlpC family hydrolase
VMQGTARNGYLYLDPSLTITRAQAVAFILRSKSMELAAATPSPPQVTGLGPVEGLASGGSKVVIVGSGFRGATSVSFGSTSVPKAGFTVESDNQITVKAAPPGTGTVNVGVTTSLGTSPTTASGSYSYLLALSAGDEVVSQAVIYLGVPYVWAGASPYGFDCSGFVMYVFGKLGVSLPHSSLLQSGVGSPVTPTLEELAPGDLLFFYSPVSHVGIYVGDGNMIDAPHTGTFVCIEKALRSNLTGARRLLPAL